MNDSILYEKNGHVATIILNRPEAFNAITVDMIEAFSAALTVAAADEGVRALILTGAGAAFCVGADLKQLKRWSQDPELRERFATGAAGLFRLLLEFPRPIIAAVNGIAAAGGFELCCVADLVVAAEDAQIGDAHANFVGFGPVSAVLAPAVLTPKLACELLLTGDLWPARKLALAGFVNHLVARERVMVCARELAEKIASKQPLALAIAKGLMRRVGRVETQPLLSEAFARAQEVFMTRDFAEGIAAFEEKRVPRFEGR